MPSHRAHPSRRAKHSRRKPAHRAARKPAPNTQRHRLTVGLLGTAIVAGTIAGVSTDRPSPAEPAMTMFAADQTRVADRAGHTGRASRGTDRAAPVLDAPRPTPGTQPAQETTTGATRTPATPSASPKPKATTASPKATTSRLPVISGLSAAQVRNAYTIVRVGRSMKVSTRGQIIAIATALQESNLLNLTVAVDHDSLGLFQQRPSAGWGTPAQLTNPVYAARKFYEVLLQYTGDWGCLTCAAQRVQVSAFPNAYAKHEAFATRIVNALS